MMESFPHLHVRPRCASQQDGSSPNHGVGQLPPSSCFLCHLTSNMIFLWGNLAYGFKSVSILPVGMWLKHARGRQGGQGPSRRRLAQTESLIINSSSRVILKKIGAKHQERGGVWKWVRREGHGAQSSGNSFAGKLGYRKVKTTHSSRERGVGTCIYKRRQAGLIFYVV